jgi:hypothetical protein
MDVMLRPQHAPSKDFHDIFHNVGYMSKTSKDGKTPTLGFDEVTGM